MRDLTTPEILVLDTLAAAWNQFLALPITHGNDLDEFMRGIHQAQNIVMARPAFQQLNGPAKETALPIAERVPAHRVVPEPSA
jgi:hypothetical protein